MEANKVPSSYNDIPNANVIVAVGQIDGFYGEGRGKQKGSKIISDVIADKHTVSIVPVDHHDPSNVTIPKNATDATIKGGVVPNDPKVGTGKGTDVTVKFDPNASGVQSPGIGIKNEDGSIGRPPEIGLIHELGHAQSMIHGLVNFVKNLLFIDPDTGNKGKLSNEEIRNRKEVDNPVRKEQGVKQRASPSIDFTK